MTEPRDSSAIRQMRRELAVRIAELRERDRTIVELKAALSEAELALDEMGRQFDVLKARAEVTT